MAKANKKTAAQQPKPPTFSNPILAQLPAPELVIMHPDLVEFDPANPAKNRGEPAEVAELAASIQQHGILNPLLARGTRQAFGKWSDLVLIAGERRLRAARHLALGSVPVLCWPRGQVSDERAMEMALVENIQRKDQAPMDECLAFEVLHSTAGITLEDIAAHVGRPVSYIHRRLSLRSLAPALRQLLSAGWISTGAAEHFARLYTSEQQHQAVLEAARGLPDADDLEGILAGKQQPEAGHGLLVTTAAARRAIEYVARELSEAPWDIADPMLVVAAGPCSSCPKRSGAQAGLFEEVSAPGTNLCMDGACWKSKTNAHRAQVVASAAAAGAKVLTAKESLALYPYPGSGMLAKPGLVDLDSPCEIPGKRGTWRSAAKSLLPDLDVVLATDRTGTTHSLVNRKELLHAAKKSGLVKPPKVEPRDGDEARRANEKADRRRRLELEDAILDAALMLAVWPSTTPGLLNILLATLWGRADSFTRQALLRRRARRDSAVTQDSLEDEALHVFVDGSGTMVLKLCLELAVLGEGGRFLADPANQPASWPGKEWAVGVTHGLLAEAAGIDVKKAAERLAGEDKPAAGKGRRGKAGALPVVDTSTQARAPAAAKRETKAAKRETAKPKGKPARKMARAK